MGSSRIFMWIGILLALLACVSWGLIFVVPEYMAAFTPLEVIMGRYFFFGLVSLAFYAFLRLKQIPRPKFPLWFQAARYALFVNIFYYINLVLAIRYSDPAVVAMIAGLSPVLIAFYANRMGKELDSKKLFFPSLLILTGLVLVNSPHFVETASIYNKEAYFFGLLCALIALCFWCWFVVSSAHFLKHISELKEEMWTSMLGICTLFWVSIIATCHYFFEADPAFWEGLIHFGPEYSVFVIGSVLLGTVSSWLAYLFWSGASKRLPVSFAGQLLIFETIFGVIAVYLYRLQFPSSTELAGSILMLGAICYSTNLFYQMAKGKTKES